MSMCLAVLVLGGGSGFSMGFGLGESKEELKLDYEISAVDHGTGRVTVVLKLADEGRLKPLTSVDLTVPGADKTGYVDLTVSLESREEDGKKVFRVHGLREWVERAEINLKTAGLDGKVEPLTWYYHSIPLDEVVKNAKASGGKRKSPVKDEGREGGPPASGRR